MVCLTIALQYAVKLMFGLTLYGMPLLDRRTNPALMKGSEDDGLIGKQKRVAYVKKDRS